MTDLSMDTRFEDGKLIRNSDGAVAIMYGDARLDAFDIRHDLMLTVLVVEGKHRKNGVTSKEFRHRFEAVTGKNGKRRTFKDGTVNEPLYWTDTLHVEWVPRGERYIILDDEYGEYILPESEMKWRTA